MGFFKDLRDLQRMGDHARDDAGMKKGLGGIKQTMDMAKDTMGGMQDQQRLMQEGRTGQATIRSISDTGKTLNENPEVEFDLEVKLDGFTYDVTHRQIVSRIAIPQFQPGATVPVHVDPEDQSKLVIG
jgi:hypothetical protein